MQFKDIVGLEDIKNHLIEMAQENKVPHAQMFLGRPGTGGLPLCLAFAQYLVCENPTDTDSCGQCSSCIKASKLIHPDIHMTYPVIRKENSKSPPTSEDFASEWRELMTANPYISEFEWLQYIHAENKQGNITREEASKIISQLNLKAFEGGYKIQIIWMAENLASVGNTLLKLIEEPPGRTVILLVAENQEAILSTILSRAQIINIPTLPKEDIQRHLTRQFNLPEEEAALFAYIADGSYRKAQQLAKGELEGFSEDLKQWMIYCMRGPSEELIKWTENKHAKGREYLKKFFEYTIHIFRETLISKYTSQKLQAHISTEEMPVSKALDKYITYENLSILIPEIEKTSYHIERNANAKIALLQLSILMRQTLRR